MKDYKIIVGKNVKRFRELKKMSQEQLANACGHDSDGARSWISKIENGKRNTTTEEIGKIAHSLDIEASDLFKDLGSISVEVATHTQELSEIASRINAYVDAVQKQEKKKKRSAESSAESDGIIPETT